VGIEFKGMDEKDAGLLRKAYLVRYEVSHSTPGETGTTLTQDLVVGFSPADGKVVAKLTLAELEAPDFDSALEKMASWCDRMAIALREPRDITASIPVLIKAKT
jgi:hypothetical protein